ncbi:hypothetical protein RB594_007878 [Gaeumannomyces avenae]
MSGRNNKKKGHHLFKQRKPSAAAEGPESQPQAAYAKASDVAVGSFRASLADHLHPPDAQNSEAGPAGSPAAGVADSAELQQAAMTIVELAASAQEAKTVAGGNDREDVTGLKTPGEFEAVFNKLYVSAPSDDGAAAPATDSNEGKAAARKKANGFKKANVSKPPRPARMEPASGQAAIKEEAITIQTSHPATMDFAFVQAAADEEPNAVQTSHPAMADPAFGQAARDEQHHHDEQQYRDYAPMNAGVGMDMNMRIAKPVAVRLPPPRSAAARRRTPEEFRQALMDQVQRIKATENEPEKLHQVLVEFRASIDERMTEFVDIRGVVFDLGCGGPYR